MFNQYDPQLPFYKDYFLGFTPPAGSTPEGVIENGVPVSVTFAKNPLPYGGTMAAVLPFRNCSLNQYVLNLKEGGAIVASAPFVGGRVGPSGTVGSQAISQVSTIVVPELDWTPNHAVVFGGTTPDGWGPGDRALQATAAEQVAAIVVTAGTKLTLSLEDWTGSAACFVRGGQARLHGDRQSRRRGRGENPEWQSCHQRRALNGQSGMVGLRITDVGHAGSLPRYLGVIVEDANGKLPVQPSHVGVGAVNGSTASAQAFLNANVLNNGSFQQYDYQYIYLNNGPPEVPLYTQVGNQFVPPAPGTPLVKNDIGYSGDLKPGSWQFANGGYDGQALIQSLRQSAQFGSIPTIVYYNLMAGVYENPSNGKQEHIGESSAIALANLQNSTYMLAYFEDFKFMMNTIRQYAQGTTVNLVLEPDLLGYMMESGKQPDQIDLGYNIGALAAAAGLFPNGTVTGTTLAAFVQAMNSGARYLNSQSVGGQEQSVNIQLGWMVNLFGPNGLTNSPPPPGTAATASFQGATTAGSNVVTGVTNIGSLRPGQFVAGAGIAPLTIIAAINSAQDTITLGLPATAASNGPAALTATNGGQATGGGWAYGISKITDAFTYIPGYTYQEGLTYVQEIATITANWYQAAGILLGGTVPGTNASLQGMNYFAIDKFGIDGGYPTGLTAPGYKAPQGEWINGMLFKKPAPFFYNGDEWNSYLTFGAAIHNVLSATGTTYNWMMWQIPEGHINTSLSINPMTGTQFPALTNNTVLDPAKNLYPTTEDSAVDYFFGDTFTGITEGADNQERVEFFGPSEGNFAGDSGITFNTSTNSISWGSHMSAAANAGVFAILFGAGLPQATNGGGYSNVPVVDDHFFAVKAQHYLAAASSANPAWR